MSRKQKRQNAKAQQPQKSAEVAVDSASYAAVAPVVAAQVPAPEPEILNANQEAAEEILDVQADIILDTVPAVEEAIELAPVQTSVLEKTLPKSKKTPPKPVEPLVVGSSIQKGGKTGKVVWIGRYPDGRKVKIKWETGSVEIVPEKELN